MSPPIESKPQKQVNYFKKEFDPKAIEKYKAYEEVVIPKAPIVPVVKRSPPVKSKTTPPEKKATKAAPKKASKQTKTDKKVEAVKSKANGVAKKVCVLVFLTY
jgi:hypothetical protein